MEKRTVHITGVIGRDWLDVMFGEHCTTYADVVAQLVGVPEDEPFDVVIDSPGGNPYEAFRIAALLESRQATAIGAMVSSAANIVFFACPTRLFSDGTVFMLHRSWVEATGNAAELEKVAAELDALDNRMFAYIAEKIGMGMQELKDLVGNEDTYIHADKANMLGFFGQYSPSNLAIAALKKNSMSYIDQIFKKAKAAIMGAKAMDLTLADGTSIFVESEDGELVGKPTDAPDGTHDLQDGRKITVAGGLVTAVEEAAGMMGDPEKDEMKAKIAELEAKLQEMNAEKAEAAKAAEAFAGEVQAKIAEQQTQIKALMKAAHSTGQPPKRQPVEPAKPLAKYELSEADQKALAEKIRNTKK